MIRHTMYHKCLRVSALLIAVVLLFQSGVIAGTERLSRHAELFVATVIGITAGVEPNDLNMLTAELTRQKQDLDAREGALREREIDARARDTSSPFALKDFILSGVLLLLTTLLIMNYLFDFLRARAQLRYAKVA